MKEKIVAILKTLAQRKMSIRRRLLILVLSCSVFSILLLTGIMIYETMGARDEFIKSGVAIGTLAAERSSQTLEREQKAHLLSFAKERSSNIDLRLEDIRQSVEMLQRTMNHIAAYPYEYPPRSIAAPKPTDGGDYMAWIFYSPHFVPSAAVQSEIETSANVQDLLIEVARVIGNGESATPYVASESGFIFEADNALPAWCFPDSSVTEPQTFDFTARPWYRRAESEGKLFFTTPYFGARDGGLAISCAAPYYRNGEFAGVVGIGASLKDISTAVLKTEIDVNGFCFVLDDRGRILFSQMREGVFAVDKTLTEDLRAISNYELAFAAKEMAKGAEGVLPFAIDDTHYYLAYSPIEETNWSFGVAIDASSVKKLLEENRAFIKQATDKQVRNTDRQLGQMNILMVAVVSFLLAVVSFAGYQLSLRLTNPILELSEGVKEISGGNLDKKINIKTGDEIEHLSDCFNEMTDKLQDYMTNLKKVTADKERIATELNVAKDIQRGMLPNIFPPYPDRKEFDIYATMNAAKEVGGDFYDLYLLDENHLVITVADVSGKGIPASLFMVISKTVLKNFATFATEPDDYAAVVACANNQLCQGNDEMMFVTVFFGVLEIDSGKFIYVNGGHNPPVVYHAAENSCEYLKVKKNFVLGGMEDVPYKQQETQLERGDLIFVYTDGVNEAMNVNNEEYTSERLLAFMNSTNCRADLRELLAAVRADVAKHVGAAAQSDDITMLALRRN